MTRKLETTSAGEVPLFSSIRELIVLARRTVARGVDLIQVLTNFEIGRRIVEHEQQGKKRAEYGKAQLSALADSLTAEFGRGFSRSNLEYMRKFFLTYRARVPDKSQLTTGKLGKCSKEPVSNGEGIPALIAGPAGGGSPFRLGWTQYVFPLVPKFDLGMSLFAKLNFGPHERQMKRSFRDNCVPKFNLGTRRRETKTGYERVIPCVS